MRKRALCALREPTSVALQLLLPVGFVALALLLLRIDVSSAGPRLGLSDLRAWAPERALPSQLPYADDPATARVVRAIRSSSLAPAPVPLDGHSGLFPDVVHALSDYLLRASANASAPAGGAAAGTGAGAGDRFGALALSPFPSPQGVVPVLALLHNSTAIHALPTLLTYAHAGWLGAQLAAQLGVDGGVDSGADGGVDGGADLSLIHI